MELGSCRLSARGFAPVCMGIALHGSAWGGFQVHLIQLQPPFPALEKLRALAWSHGKPLGLATSSPAGERGSSACRPRRGCCTEMCKAAISLGGCPRAWRGAGSHARSERVARLCQQGVHAPVHRSSMPRTRPRCRELALQRYVFAAQAVFSDPPPAQRSAHCISTGLHPQESCRGLWQGSDPGDVQLMNCPNVQPVRSASPFGWEVQRGGWSSSGLLQR